MITFSQPAAPDVERLYELALDLGEAVKDLSDEVAALRRRVDETAPPAPELDLDALGAELSEMRETTRRLNQHARRARLDGAS